MASSGGAGAMGGAMSGAQAGSAFGPWGTAIGAVVGGVGGYLSGSKAKKAQFDPYGTLNPEQRAIVQSVGPRIQQLATQGPVQYTGQLTAGMTPEESGFYNPTRAGLLSGTYDSYLQEASDPVTRASAFRTNVSDPAYQMFKENVLPGILEGYSGFSTASGNRAAQEYRNLTSDLLTRKFEYDEAAKNRGLSAMGETPTLQNYYAAPRTISQAGLDRQYNEYIRANEENRANIDKALSFLGISTSTYTPERPDTRWSGAFQGALGGASLGSSLGGGTGRTSANNLTGLKPVDSYGGTAYGRTPAGYTGSRVQFINGVPFSI